MSLSLAPPFSSKQDATDRCRNRCPFPIVQKLLLTALLLIEPMNYLASALAVGPLSAQTPREIQGRCETESEDVESVAETDVQENGERLEEVESTTSPEIMKRRKGVRTKTRLHFCHPPPSTKQKRLRTRPKILLQLQKKSKATRPIPTYDVLSTTAFTSRFAQELPQTFKGKSITAAEELAVVKSEDYSYKDAQTDDFDDVLQDDVKAREVVATISHHGGDEPGSLYGADICLSKGRTWVATPMHNGGFEFVASEESGHRLVARWVPRKRPRGQSNSRRVSSPIRAQEGKAFNFSLLDPRARRHAVIATFDAQELEILDRYSSPRAEANNRFSTSTLDTLSTVNERDLKEVDEAMRTLIVATSIWVSYCEGFFGSCQSTAEPTRIKGFDPIDRRKSLLVDVKDHGKARNSLERASSVQGLTTPTSPASALLVSPPFSIPSRRTQSTSSPLLMQSHERQNLSRRAETMNPIFDTDTEISPLDSRTSLEDETGDPNDQGHKHPSLSATGEKNHKRSKSIKKLCCSFKKSERNSSSS